MPENQWVKAVKDNLRKKFPEGVTVGNSAIKIDAQTRREMTWSRYSQWLRNAAPDVYADKLRATNNADGILLASRDYINEGLNHPRKDDIRDFARGTVKIRIGTNDYTADVIVGGRGDGSMVLYDLLNLQPTQIKERSQARQTGNPSLRAGRNTVTDFIDSIPASSEKSNTDSSKKPQKSIEGTRERGAEIERLARQNKRLEKLNRELKDQLRVAQASGAVTDRAAVKTQAKEILRSYGSKYDAEKLTDMMVKLYDAMANGKLSSRETNDRAYEIAEIQGSGAAPLWYYPLF